MFWRHWNPREWYSRCVGMTLEEKDIVREMMNLAWIQEDQCTLPNDDAMVAGMVGVPVEVFHRCREAVGRFFSVSEDKLVCGYLLEQKARAGKRRGGGDARAGSLRAETQPWIEMAPDESAEPKTLMLFPVRGRNRWWKLREDDYRRLCVANPGRDIRRELEKARAWLEFEPSRRKTPGGMMRYLNRWMSNNQYDESFQREDREDFFDNYMNTIWAPPTDEVLKAAFASEKCNVISQGDVTDDFE